MKKNKEKNPFDWDNITIEKYYNIKDILDDETDDDITKNVKLVAVITGKDENDVWNMDMAEAGEYISRLQFLNKFELPKNPNMKIKLPNYDLVVIKDLTKINVAQYVDFQNFVKTPMKEGMEKILSIFLIPDGCKYNEGYDIIDLQKEIRENLSFRVAEGSCLFYREIRKIIDSFPGLLQASGEEDQEQGDDGEVGEDGEGTATETGQFNTFNWLYQIKKVSDLTKYDWGKVWELQIYEFLNYLQFDMEYRKMEERELSKWKATH